MMQWARLCEASLSQPFASLPLSLSHNLERSERKWSENEIWRVIFLYLLHIFAKSPATLENYAFLHTHTHTHTHAHAHTHAHTHTHTHTHTHAHAHAHTHTRMCVTVRPICESVSMTLVSFVTLFSRGMCVSSLIKVNPCEAAGAPLPISPIPLPCLPHPSITFLCCPSLLIFCSFLPRPSFMFHSELHKTSIWGGSISLTCSPVCDSFFFCFELWNSFYFLIFIHPMSSPPVLHLYFTPIAFSFTLLSCSLLLSVMACIVGTYG